MIEYNYIIIFLLEIIYYKDTFYDRKKIDSTYSELFYILSI